MDPMISLGQNNTLVEYMILSGADNRPPMLDKDLYDSWKIEENGVIRTKKYAELSAAEKIQADGDMKATYIILQGLPTDIYSLVNHHRVAKDLWERVQLLMQRCYKYVKDMLTKFDMESVRTATTPYEAAKTKLKDETDPPVNVHLYRSMIGSLMYLTASRPDIMFAVSACSRHQVTPLTSHLNAVKKIFKYLKGQPKLGLWYPKDSPFQLEAYSDSDYAGSHGDRKSTTGGCQFLGRRLISWQCKKQTIVATSSTEAEYVAAASCCAQVLWIQNQLLDYGFNFMNTKIFIDNQSTICIVKNPGIRDKARVIISMMFVLATFLGGFLMEDEAL
ncbi:hypothetical protein Tco_0921985 [Tanacetum coccineum]|uniref:Reverse transcriptase Ty1/copia-type domain-containing protein n=1 Tax=Tanacetum coccineum TaxID=301880 RepID=A0ABQ5CWT9_9ASTR